MNAIDLLRAARSTFPNLVPVLLLDEETHSQLVVSLCDREKDQFYNYKLDDSDLSKSPQTVIDEIVAMRLLTSKS